MDEVMNALRLKDNHSIKVKKVSKIKWEDCETNEVYYIHIDIELLY